MLAICQFNLQSAQPTAVTQELPVFWFLLRDETPRTVLVESAIEVVDQTLGDRASK